MRELRIRIDPIHNFVNGDNGSIGHVLNEPFRFFILKRKKGSEDLK